MTERSLKFTAKVIFFRGGVSISRKGTDMPRKKKVPDGDLGAGIDVSSVPEPVEGLTPREKKVWRQITFALAKQGLIHETDAIMLHLVCQTFVGLMDATLELEDYKDGNNGSVMVVLPNSYSKPHELVAVVSELRRELARYLKECGMTTASFIELMKMQKDAAVAERNAANPLDEFVRNRPGIQ